MSDPVWPDIEAVCAVAAEFMAAYGHEFRVLNRDGLENLLGRTRQYSEYRTDADLATLAAVLIESIAQAHVLVDGNKRLAFLFAYVFLRLNGPVLDMRETGEGSAHEMVIGLVERRLDVERVARTIRSNC